MKKKLKKNTIQKTKCTDDNYKLGLIIYYEGIKIIMAPFRPIVNKFLNF